MSDIETGATPKRARKAKAAQSAAQSPDPQATAAPSAALVRPGGGNAIMSDAGKLAERNGAENGASGRAPARKRKPKAALPVAEAVEAVTGVKRPRPKRTPKPPVLQEPFLQEPVQAPLLLDVAQHTPAPSIAAAPAPRPEPEKEPAPAPKKAEAAKTQTAEPAKTQTAEPAPAPAEPPLVAAQPMAPAAPARPKDSAKEQPAPGVLPIPDFTALSQNLAKLVEKGSQAAAAYLKPLEDGRTNPDLAEHVEDAVKTLGHVADYWLRDPKRAIEAQHNISGPMLELWARTLRKMAGEETAPVRAPDPGDKRFADPEWSRNPIYDFLRQAYGITTDWANDLVTRADSLDPVEREKAQFYLRQIAGAVSPSNFIATNPELLRTTLEQSGENLVRGMQMLAEDIKAGHGQLKIRQSDASKFVLGRDMAATPGKVIYRNDLMELIQYAPTTDTVYKRPLLIVPPWINKFYVLDLNPEKSFIRWAVAQGLTIFVISWVNPDERHADKSFEDYMREGILTALDCVEQATGERKVASIGYCVGGTLLAITLAYMAATGDDRIESSTFLTTQVDFRDAGELKLFVDQVRIKAIEEKMKETGYLEGAKMATAFNMLRPNELIWSYVVNNYLKGKEPMPFDLLAWNSDSTRMPAANHSFYLRNCYLENNLTQGRLDFAGVRLDLKKVKIPVYHLATKEDHIAPARSVYTGARFFGGPVRYVLAGSGHIAGVVNPAGKPKYQFWAGPPVGGSYEDWLQEATETTGTWWGDWIGWLTAQAPERVPARQPGGPKLAPIGEAPGEYVRVKA